MAHGFDNDKYLSGGTPPVTIAPLTLFAVTRPNKIRTGQVVISIGASGTGTNRFQLAHSNIVESEVVFFVVGNTQAQAQGPIGSVTNSAWNYLLGVERSSSDREVYVNAISKATDTQVVVPLGINATYIGARNNNGIGAYATGSIAEAAIWNVALTDAEIASLAKGFKPTRIRPQSLVFYAPLLRNLQDLRGGLALTNNNGATVADHPRVY